MYRGLAVRMRQDFLNAPGWSRECRQFRVARQDCGVLNSAPTAVRIIIRQPMPDAAAVSTSAEGKFVQGLGLLDSTMIVAGSMIGSGIFIVSADIARQVGSSGWLLMVWLITGLLTLSAALSYGELAAMMPRAGGQYVYLREAYSPLWGFLYGWTMFLVIQTGTIAAVSVAFAKFLGVLIPSLSEKETNPLFTWGRFAVYSKMLVAIGVLVFLTWSNSTGLKTGKLVQNVFTFTKIASLAGLIL